MVLTHAILKNLDLDSQKFNFTLIEFYYHYTFRHEEPSIAIFLILESSRKKSQINIQYSNSRQ